MKKDNPLRVFLYCSAATILNVITSEFAMFTLGLPLFFDTEFSMAVLFYFGLAPALCVQFAYHILMLFGPLYLRYGVLDFVRILYVLPEITALFVVWLFIRKKALFSHDLIFLFLYLILAAIAAGIAGSITGSLANVTILTFHHNSVMSSNVEQTIDTFRALRISPFLALFLGRIPITILDKSISTLFGFSLSKVITYIHKRKNEKERYS